MKLRCGFVSNSSSGSFIFPKGYTIESTINKLNKIIDIFHDDLGMDNCGFEKFFNEPFIITREFLSDHRHEFDEFNNVGVNGLSDLYRDRVVVNTAFDNSVPYQLHIMLCDGIGVEYLHWQYRWLDE